MPWPFLVKPEKNLVRASVFRVAAHSGHWTGT
jgi:hypothetical protein